MIVDIRSEEAKHTLGALNFAYEFKRKGGKKTFHDCLRDSYIDIDVNNNTYNTVSKSNAEKNGFSSVAMLTFALKERSSRSINNLCDEKVELNDEVEECKKEIKSLCDTNREQIKIIKDLESENREYAAANEGFAKNEKVNNETYTNVCNQLTAEKNSLRESVKNLKTDLREQCNLTDSYLTELNQLKGALAFLIK